MNKYDLFRKLIEDGDAEQYFADDLEVTAANLQAAGLDFNAEELHDLGMAYQTSLGDTGEISLDELEMVAGGALKIPNPFKGIKLSDLFKKGDGNWFNKYLGNLEKITRGGY